MFYHRAQKLIIVVLLTLHASAGSFAATVIYVQTMGGLTYKSTDSAKTWQALATPTLPNAVGLSSGLAVDPQNTNNLYTLSVTPALRGQGVPQYAINRSTDGGQSWTGTLLANPAAPPLTVDTTMSNIIYLVGNEGQGNAQSWRSSDYGATFQAGANPVFGYAIKTDPSQPGVVYLVGQGNTTKTGTVPAAIYRSTDYGVTWAVLVTNSTIFGNPSGVIADLAVDPKNSSVLYVAARSSTCGTSTARCGLIKSTDAGKTWQPVFGDDCGNAVVDPRNGNVYAGCYRAGTASAPRPTGEVAKSTDGGKTFTSITSGLNSLGVEVHLDPESPGVLYGSQSRVVGLVNTGGAAVAGGVFVSTDSGSTWTLSSLDAALKPPNDEVYSLTALTIANPPAGVVNVSAAGGRTDLFAPNAIVSAFGAGLAAQPAGATTNPPLTTLGGATVTVTDSAGTSLPAPLLYVSPAQINYIVPAGVAAGPATVAFNSGSSTQNQKIQLGPVAPGMFTFNAAGLVAGSVLRVSAGGDQTAENLFQLDSSGNVVALPVNLGPATDQVFLILYGTGFRAAGTANTTMTIGGQSAEVSFAGDQGAFAGLDQVNVLVPRSLAGRGSVNIVLTASGQTANTVSISIQ